MSTPSARSRSRCRTAIRRARRAYIALSDVADVRLETGAAYIYRENSQRFIPLKYSVRERDLGSTVAEAQERIAKNVPLPPGYRMEWSGEFGALQEAKKRLAVIVPLSLLLILALLYSLFNSVRHSLIALSGIPFAVAGGILGLYVAGLNLSVSAAVGFISLFGVAAMDGILLVSYIRRDLEEGMGTETAIIQAGEARMRQVFMTGFSACIGLVPAALSTGIGSQVQQPLACVIVGGMLLSPICSLLVIPTVARLMMREVAGTHGRRSQGRAGAGVGHILKTFFTFTVVATALVLPDQATVTVGRLVGHVLVETGALAGLVRFFVAYFDDTSDGKTA